MENLNKIVSQNLVSLRVKSGFTQLQVAEKINYSDKSISKWERGEAIPDVSVLMQLAEMYGVTLNDIVKDYGKKEIKPRAKRIKLSQHTLITIIAFSCVWFLATVGFAVIYGFYNYIADKAYLSFIVAIPVSLMVVMAFSFCWYPYYISAIFSSAFLWTTILAITQCIQVTNIWLLYIIVIPLQLIILLGFALQKLIKKFNKEKETNEK